MAIEIKVRIDGELKYVLQCRTMPRAGEILDTGSGLIQVDQVTHHVDPTKAKLTIDATRISEGEDEAET